MQLVHDDHFASTFVSGGRRCRYDFLCLVFRNRRANAVNFDCVDVATTHDHVADAISRVIGSGKNLGSKRSCGLFFAASFRPYEQVSVDWVFHCTP